MSQPASSPHEQRLANLAKITGELNLPAHPDRFERTHTPAEVFELEPGVEGIATAGRITAIRDMGKLTFMRIQDFNGSIQLVIQRDVVDETIYKSLVKKLLDIGDFVGARGDSYRTNRGEPSLLVREVVFLGKALRGLPEKWHGLVADEARYRQRYLDVIANEESRQRFRIRHGIIRFLRHFLEDHRFEEVETPVLVSQASGALARPFLSHHQALDLEVTLRIAPETYLKRCIVAGFDRVFEFARCFRNEGMDPSHLQDFTMLEYYAAYWNAEDNMNFTETMFAAMVQEVMGSAKVEIRGKEIDFTPPYPRLSFAELLRDQADLDLDAFPDAQDLAQELKRRKIQVTDEDAANRGRLIDLAYKKLVRPSLKGPVFLTGHPIELSPLARRNDDNPEISDRFQLVIQGWEVVNAYSELVDPIDQRDRLLAQAEARQRGDDEALPMDHDYLKAMEHGMPPISGWGAGIDRLAALFSNADNLRDVVLFPLMRPEASDDSHDEAEDDPSEASE